MQVSDYFKARIETCRNVAQFLRELWSPNSTYIRAIEDHLVGQGFKSEANNPNFKVTAATINEVGLRTETQSEFRVYSRINSDRTMNVIKILSFSNLKREEAVEITAEHHGEDDVIESQAKATLHDWLERTPAAASLVMMAGFIERRPSFSKGRQISEPEAIPL